MMEMRSKWTHAQLVKRAIKWLWGQGCVVVISEMAGQSQEPDAIGFHHTHSILVECKASRADFLSDKYKCHHRAGNSMGDKRYYFAPLGMIKVEELPDGWGLLEPHGKRTFVIEESKWFHDKSDTMEAGLLISTMRRIKGMMPQGTSVKSYYYLTGNRATFGIKPTEPISSQDADKDGEGEGR